jgi:hypothetical protein
VAVESGAREQTAVRCPPGHRASPATAVPAVNRDVHLDIAVEAALRGDEAAFARVHARVADEKRSNQPSDQPAATTDMACIRCGNQWQSKARAKQVIKAPTGTAVIDRR